MKDEHRSGCPINLTLELLGDSWSLLIIRDMVFSGKRHFRELLQSGEGISSNILADRLRMLVEAGLLTRASDPTHKQKIRYSLTEKSIDLVPVLIQIGIWGRKHTPLSSDHDRFTGKIEAGGPGLWAQIMADLRAEHLGVTAAPQPGD